MDEQGIVVEVNQDTVVVKMKRSSACSRCGNCKKAGNDQEVLVTAKNNAQAKLHDKVRISMEADAFLQAIGILYGIPLVALLIGFVAGTYVGEALNIGEYSSLTGFGGGIFMAFTGYVAIRLREPKREKHHRAAVVEVLPH